MAKYIMMRADVWDRLNGQEHKEQLPEAYTNSLEGAGEQAGLAARRQATSHVVLKLIEVERHEVTVSIERRRAR